MARLAFPSPPARGGARGRGATALSAVTLGAVTLGAVTLGAVGLGVVGLDGGAPDGTVAASRRPAGEADAPFPAHLSATGLYAADGSIDPRNRSFVPQYPLWTDGAAKRRWVQLPDGVPIDVRDPEVWRFPAGTTFWKEFRFHGRPVETRMIRLRADGSAAYATYAWNAEGTEATLVPEGGIARAHEIAPSRWHAIPATADCRSCHESGPSRILGFSASQLADERDPLAPHAEPVTPSSLTLRTLVAEDRLRPRRDTHAARLAARTDLERAALGYLATNCGTCHQAGAPLARLGFSLRPGASDSALAALLAHAGRFAMPGDTAGSRLIVPGAPEASVVLHRMQTRRAATQMPPLGSVLVDSVGVDLVRRWIAAMR